ncbi:hypothetical protein KSS87_007279 [Heliosperma pusillum]|nr:hypothetical protein KSS87_007279 [Heliosperma pusillum]
MIIHSSAELPKQEVRCIESDQSPCDRVQKAVECLPSISDKSSFEIDHCFRHWTIMDYSKAYKSGAVTPRKEEQNGCIGLDRAKGMLAVLTVLDHVVHYLLGKPICRSLVPGATRNPYNTSRITGGSSSGSAALVRSVRIPAALCGVVGFKPTFGRVPHEGVLPLNWTVGMVGILAGTVEDALITYAAISGESSSDESTALSHKVELPFLKPKTFSSDIKVAKYGKWFNDCHSDIKLCCSKAIEKLQRCYGWQTVEVTVPEIETMRLAHYLTIGSECVASLDHILQKLDNSEVGWDSRIALSIYGSFSGVEYIKAQKIRNRQIQFFNKIFSKADVIVTPTTGVTATRIQNDALETGELDYITGAALVRYIVAGNFLGLPAVTLPIGYDKDGLPIGLQFIGRPWSEATLLHISSAVQALFFSDYKKPNVYYDLLHTP